MAFISGDSANIPSITLERQAGTPANAPTGKVRLFIDDADPDNFIKLVDESGTVYSVGTGGLLTGAAPDDAEYILKTADVSLPNALDLSALNTGRLNVTNATGDLTSLKDNLSAVVAPTINDDSGDGYAVGSFWLDTAAEAFYICVDATVGAAVWMEASGGGGGGVPAATNLGDLIVGETVGVYNVLGLGTNGQQLRVNTSDLTYGMEWFTPSTGYGYDNGYVEIVEPPLSSWTEYNASYTDSDFTGPYIHIEYDVDTNVSDIFAGIWRTAPGGSTWEVKALLDYSSNSDSHNVGFGLTLRDNTDVAPTVCVGVIQGSFEYFAGPQRPRFGRLVWEDNMTLMSGVNDATPFNCPRKVWLKLRKNSNNYYGSWSMDGTNWSPEWSYNSSMGVHELGVGVFHYGSPPDGDRLFLNVLSWEVI